MNKCKSCGGNLIENEYGKYQCSWCGRIHTDQEFALEEMDKISDLETFSLLNKARLAIELEYNFTKSLKFSHSVLEKNPESQEANWLAMLAVNRIIYIQNDKGKYTPTFLEPEKASLKQCKYYAAFNPQYRANADEVEKIRLDTVAEFKKVKPYDVFISYKQHESDTAETKEAVWARDIYTELKTNPQTRHLNVFFDQKCLSGANVGWEPHIYAAIRSSKCMIILGSSLENVNSRWVKNEWKRFLAFKAQEKQGKRDFIVLGSDSVNPLLLDEELQEKQMISNTSGKWLNEVVARVAEICGKPKKEVPEVAAAEVKPKKPKKRLNKKAVAAIACSLTLVLAGGALGGGLTYKAAMDGVNDTAELINYLPDYEIQDYAQYDALIDEAYTSYEKLSSWQKGRVSNKARLLGLIDGYNEYKVANLRASVAGISVDTVAETEHLKNAVTQFQNLKAAQRDMLSGEEKFALDNYAKVYAVITALNEVNDDVLSKYGEVEGIKRQYLTISADYKDLVYNYGLVDTFAAQVEFHNSFTYNKVAGGYSIALKEGKTLSGEVELPAKYKGESVVEIPEGAFADCRNITALTVPDSVSTIGKGAFQGCNNVVDITLPFTGKSETAENYKAVFGWIFGLSIRINEGNEVSETQVYNQSFAFTNKSYELNGLVCQYSCQYSSNHRYSFFYSIPTMLRTVTITKQTDIPLAAFNGCRMLEAVTYSKTVNNLGGYAFQNCVSLQRFNSSDEGVADLSGTVETVGAYAFCNCQTLTDIVIPQSVHVFEEHAFDGCRNVKELNLTDRITVIGDYAFQGLQLLKQVTVYNSTNSIGLGAFQGCNNLVDISLPFTGKSETAKSYEAVFGYIFGLTFRRDNGNYAQSYYISTDGVFKNQTIEVSGALCQFAYTYSYNDVFVCYYIPTTLRTVTITKQTDIPLAAFNGCRMLTKVTYNNRITSTGEYAFQNCVSPTQK